MAGNAPLIGAGLGLAVQLYVNAVQVGLGALHPPAVVLVAQAPSATRPSTIALPAAEIPAHAEPLAARGCHGRGGCLRHLAGDV